MNMYRYAQLEVQLRSAKYLYYLNKQLVNKGYEELSLIDVLNLLGKDGWMLVSSLDSDNHILMKQTV